MQIDWMATFGMAAVAVLAAMAGLLLMAALQPRLTSQRGTVFAERDPGASFLFDGEVLVDATPDARALLSISGMKGAPWPRLLAYLVPRFPGLEARLARLAEDGRITMASDNPDQPLMLRAEMRGGLTRITLIDPEEGAAHPGHDSLGFRAQEEELALLRGVVAQAPLMIWRETAAGDITWANAAYLIQAGQMLEPGKDLTWPLLRLFDRTAIQQGAPRQRQRLQTPASETWFDLTALPEQDGHLVFAQPADALVQAETGLREFMQTLTKTFAHLTTGLAIFDRQRQLALFNPALLDLTGLPPDFLTMRPTLFAFLDAMRDRNMIPEPKDYRNWRKQMMEIEAAAAQGTFEETWSLPSGQTYRVIGRPHPNGALALLFEDISTEISRIRRYREDMELGQAVFDAVDPALAVFSPAGKLVMSNAAYAALWEDDPGTALDEGSFAALCRHWRAKTAPSPIWEQADAFVASLSRPEALTGEARLTDGRLVQCRFASLPGGATMAAFHLSGSDQPFRIRSTEAEPIALTA